MQMRFKPSDALVLAGVLFAIALVSIAGCQRPATEAVTDAHPQATGASAATSAANPEAGPGGWFVKTGCIKCHSISVYGLKSETNIGPDLSIAEEDVKSRFGVPLEEFLAAPSGTMAIVLSTQIQLTPEQKQTAIAKLKEAHAEYLRQQASGRAADTANSTR
jgi:hypothetical protein